VVLVFNIVRTHYSAHLGCPVNSLVDPFSLLSIQHLQNDRIVTKIQHEFRKESNSLRNTICKPRFLQILNYHPSPTFIHGENVKTLSYNKKIITIQINNMYYIIN
jgi:hypothetical protein